MSGTYLTVNGAYNGVNGLVTIAASDFAGTAGGALNTALQSYLTGVSNALALGQSGQPGLNLVNYNALDSVTASFSAGASATGTYYEITNFDSTGVTTAGSTGTSGAPTTLVLPSDVNILAVQAPGYEDITASGNVTAALFSADSNVTFHLNEGNSSVYSGNIYFAGGADKLRLSNATVASVNVYSAGNDTVNLGGVGFVNAGGDTVHAEGSATTTVIVGGSEYVTVVASDNAIAKVNFVSGSGENLFYQNLSTQSQIIETSAFMVNGVSHLSTNAITAYGGAGGLFAVGGAAGNNSLAGGTGLVTLIGGGNHDVLRARAYETSGIGNVLFTGNGSFESLYGAASSANNQFDIGDSVAGVGVVNGFQDVVSTMGSGVQKFLINNDSNSTIYGSTVTGATNIYYVAGDSLTGSTTGNNNSVTWIADFSGNSTVHMVNFDGGALLNTIASSSDSVVGSGANKGLHVATVNLTDGSSIEFRGLTVSQLKFSVGGDSIGYN